MLSPCRSRRHFFGCYYVVKNDGCESSWSCNHNGGSALCTDEAHGIRRACCVSVQPVAHDDACSHGDRAQILIGSHWRLRPKMMSARMIRAATAAAPIPMDV
jgi:hypothetical protein